jgi:hypothetical protein
MFFSSIAEGLELIDTNELKVLRADALRWQYFVANGHCHAKNPHGVDIGNRLKSFVSMRYWCSAKDLNNMVDSRIYEEDADELRSNADCM